MSAVTAESGLAQDEVAFLVNNIILFGVIESLLEEWGLRGVTDLIQQAYLITSGRTTC